MTDYIQDLIEEGKHFDDLTPEEVAEAYADFYAVRHPRSMSEIFDFSQGDPYPLICDLLFKWEDPGWARAELIKLLNKAHSETVEKMMEEETA